MRRRWRAGLSPLDGVLVPTFGAFYVTVTLLFPFVAIRALGREKESGALRLLVQLPYRAPTLIAAKMAAVMIAFMIAIIPALSALVLWAALGGHLQALETGNLVLGHLIYGLLVAAIALVRRRDRRQCRDRRHHRRSRSPSAPGCSTSRSPASRACWNGSRACR